MDASIAVASATRKHHGGAVTLLTTRASSYASSNALSDDDTTGTSSTYFSSLSLANASLPSSISANYSSSAAAGRTIDMVTTISQVPLGMGYSTTSCPSQCYRTLEEPSAHEDYDGLELHHTVSEKTQETSYYDYSYDPEEEMGSIL